MVTGSFPGEQKGGKWCSKGIRRNVSRGIGGGEGQETEGMVVVRGKRQREWWWGGARGRGNGGGEGQEAEGMVVVKGKRTSGRMAGVSTRW
jgi:hypothetical protein